MCRPTIVSIDHGSGFCFGVTTAISKAEDELKRNGSLYCLGDIVHNGQEVDRLTRLGLQTIEHDRLAQLHDTRVLLRAHGEPPETYQTARQNGITLIDATCPVVLRLQQRIRAVYCTQPDTQIVIYGKKGHAEVVGLEGQTNNTAIVVECTDDLQKVDMSRDIALFSQTTKSIDGFSDLVDNIRQQFRGQRFDYYDTICRQVANRIPDIINFAQQNDILIFVGGKKSSNGKVLYQHCLKANSHTYFVSSPEEIDSALIDLCRGQRVGICGATSTPLWLMQQCAEKIRQGTDRP
ncbi:MAG: 4-hydroxy-3-methylbut-2-enyl diphosphate reductase [Paludibacteraceae bacterium]|nr:4-hydroxy-3-methylbut-2-enyl diphosphate reductase [Paludibacteraceae bacterium]